MNRLTLVALTALLLTLIPSESKAQDPFIGEIRLMGTSYCPQNWAEADGSLLNVAENDALFSLFSCTFGGDCQTTFALPDLRGRVPVGIGAGPGLTPRNLGTTGGVESVELAVSQMPTHKHSLSGVTLKGTMRASLYRGDAATATDALLAVSGRTSIYSSAPAVEGLDFNTTSLASGSVSVTGQSWDEVAASGGGQPHNNMPPYVALRYCVALDGIYPQRPD